MLIPDWMFNERVQATSAAAVTGVEKLVLLALLLSEAKHGIGCVANVGELARGASCSDRTAQVAIGRLAARGLMEVLRSPGAPNTYIVDWAKVGRCR